MRINEIIVEQQLDEGPLGSAVGAVGRGIGKVIGGVAKGVGAIAGIGAGAKRAFQKGKQASVDVIGGSGQGADAPVQKAAPAATAAAPAAAPAGGGTSAAQPAASGAAQGGAPAAASAQPAAQPAAQGGAPAAQPAAKPAAGGGDVDAIIQQVDQLQPPEKKEVLAALQKPAAPAKEEPAAQPAAQGGAEQPAAQPAAQGGAPAAQGGNFDAQTGKPTSQTGQNLEKQVQDAKQAAAQKMGRGLSPQEEQEIEGEIRGTMKPKAAPPADDNPNIVRGTESVQRRGKMVREYTEEFILYRPQTVRTTLRESRKPKQKFSIYKSQ